MVLDSSFLDYRVQIELHRNIVLVLTVLLIAGLCNDSFLEDIINAHV